MNEQELCPACGGPYTDCQPPAKCPGLDDIDIDVAHVVWRDGKCRLSVNGQGHFMCKEHNSE